MEEKNLLKNNITFLLIILLLVSCIYLWLDRPLVFWVNDHVVLRTHFFKLLTVLPDVVTLAAVLLYCYVFWQIVNNRRIYPTALALANTIAITEFLKNFFKIVFGRFWPATWQANNPSLLNNHVYGFNFFHSGVAYQSFPSGHTATIFAFATIMWFLYPKFRFLYVLLCCLVPVGLLAMNYHFLSDIIGGAYLGSTVAIGVHQVNKRYKRY